MHINILYLKYVDWLELMTCLALKGLTIWINKFKCKIKNKKIYKRNPLNACRKDMTDSYRYFTTSTSRSSAFKSVIIPYLHIKLHRFPFVCHHRNEHSHKYRLLFFILTKTTPVASFKLLRWLQLYEALAGLRTRCTSVTQIRRCSCDPRGFIQHQTSIFPVWQN